MISRVILHPISTLVKSRACVTSLQVRYSSAVATEANPSNRPSTQYTQPTHPPLDKTTLTNPTTSQTLELSSEYTLGVYARPDLVLSHGEGSWVWDTEGRKYLDFSAGIAVNALGHADKQFNAVMAKQASKLLHTSNVYHNEWSPKLAQLLIELTRSEGGLGWASGELRQENVHKGPGAKVFFANSGTEANEGAMKIAKKVGKERWAAKSGQSWDSLGCTKTRIACFKNSFHGRSMGALSVTSNTKYQAPFTPLIPNVDVGKLNDYGGLQMLVTEDTYAVIVEPIQGEGGINTAETEWLKFLRKRCDEVGAVLIFDEIQCGLYRSGTIWAHSALPVECHPDMVTMAKPLANGYPIGAVMMRDEVAHAMTPGTHGTTFGGSPLACALGHHVLSRISDRQFVSHIAETGEYLTARLALLSKWFPELLEEGVRGRGLIVGAGFKNAEHPGKVVSMARERGVFVLTAGKDAVRLVPSLNVEKKEVDFCVDVLESCLSALRSAGV